MGRKLVDSMRLVGAELDRSRLGFGPSDEPIREPMSWPYFLGSLSASILWSLTRIAVLFIVVSALIWSINGALVSIVASQPGISPPIWGLIALFATVYCVVETSLFMGLGLVVGTTARRAAWRCVLGIAVLGISVLAAATGWPLWAAYLTVFAAVSAHRMLRHL